MYKKTKIVATISDARCDIGLLRDLYEAGMNVVRLNTAHQDAEGMRRVINNVREVSSHIAVLVDTKGPEVRTTKCDAPIPFKQGETVEIVADPALPTTHERISVSYPGFVHDVHEGAQILIDDGVSPSRMSLGMVLSINSSTDLTPMTESIFFSSASVIPTCRSTNWSFLMIIILGCYF